MLFDCHVHSKMSVDAELDPVLAIEMSKDRNIGIIFTEHYDENGTSGFSGFKTDPKLYLSKYQKYRADNILLGFEIGVSHKYIESNKAVAENNDFDFIIGSVHNVNSLEIDIDYFHQNPDKQEEYYYSNYLEHTASIVEKNTYFDALGHIDYISRYSKFETKNIEYEKYKDLYDKIFKNLITTDKVLEINTRRFGDKIAVDGLRRIFQGYYNVGGRFATIGSDAHDKNVLFNAYHDALELLQDIGITPVYFKERKMLPCL